MDVNKFSFWERINSPMGTNCAFKFSYDGVFFLLQQDIYPQQKYTKGYYGRNGGSWVLLDDTEFLLAIDIFELGMREA